MPPNTGCGKNGWPDSLFCAEERYVFAEGGVWGGRHQADDAVALKEKKNKDSKKKSLPTDNNAHTKHYQISYTRYLRGRLHVRFACKLDADMIIYQFSIVRSRGEGGGSAIWALLSTFCDFWTSFYYYRWFFLPYKVLDERVRGPTFSAKNLPLRLSPPAPTPLNSALLVQIQSSDSDTFVSDRGLLQIACKSDWKSDTKSYV